MTRPFTVYFDTNFFVWLAKATEKAADATVEKLNALGVRHVLSDILLQELLTSANKPDRDELLFKRTKRFGIAPYRTNENLMWEGLLSTGVARKAAADWFVLTDNLQTEAISHSIMARRMFSGRVNSEQFDQLSRATTPFLEEMGFSPKLEDSQHNIQALQDFIERLGNLLPEEIGLRNFKLSGDATEDSKRLLDLLDPDACKGAQESNLLNESTTASEDRPYQVASALADATTRRSLGHTIRDAEHMKTFVLHQDQIDFLQVDRAQLNQINRRNPPHRLAELGLANRCFTAASLDDAIRIIEAFLTAI
jgi:hypothetical protein